MKTRTFLLALFAMVAFNMNAQKTVDRTYLDKAIAELQVGNCNGAHVFYTVYLGMGGDTMPAIENLISECSHANDTAKFYKVGDVIRVGNDLYTVAHVTNEGKHGFAICEMGSGEIDEKIISEKRIPSWSEFEIIKSNNDTLKLAGSFWSSNPYLQSNSCQSAYKTCGIGNDFSDGYGCSNSSKRSLIYVYRF